MNNVLSLINQQRGSSNWRDIATPLSRLQCTKNEEYTQILPDEDDWNSDTVEPPIFACKFSQKEGYEHILALANEDGKLAIHDTKNKKPRYGCDAHQNAIFDLAWMFEQMKLVTVSGDHSACLQEVSESDIRSTQIFEGHTRSVKTVAFRYKDSNVFATGGRDGTIITWDARNNQSMIGKVDCCLFNTHRFRTPSAKSKRRKNYLTTTVSGADSVTGLVFQDENSLISCGAGDGMIKVWDMRKTYSNYTHDPLPKFVLPYSGSTMRNGFSNLVLDRSSMKLYANCLDNNIYCYNIGTYESYPHMKYFGHENSTYYVKACLSNDGRYLMSGSSDENAYIWDVTSSTPIIKLTGHQAEVTCVAWCPAPDVILVTCSDDLRHKIWRIGKEMLPENWEIEGSGTAVRLKNGVSNRLKRNFASLISQCAVHSNCKNDEKKKCHCKSAKRIIQEEASGNKVLLTSFGPKKLFCNIDQNVEESIKTNQTSLATPLEQDFDETEIPFKKMKLSDKENVITKSKRFIKHEDLLYEMPLKKCKMESSEKDSSSSSSEIVLPTVSEDEEVPCKIRKIERDSSERTSSVIADLPNYVLDGRAPHLSVSPIKRVEKDWLTKFRIEKSLTKRIQDSSTSISPKNTRTEQVRSPRSHKNSPASSQSPLLKFFRVTSSNNQQYVPKSSSLGSFTQQTQSAGLI